MPPVRLELFTALRFGHAGAAKPSSIRSLSTTPSAQASTVAQKRRRQDPYALAQARARRAANLSRQEVLQTQRSKAFGDPIRGLTTPFVKSFDTAGLGSEVTEKDGTRIDHLNHFVSAPELNNAVAQSYLLTTPTELSESARGSLDPTTQAQQAQQHSTEHETAQEALSRIVSLANSSSKDRTRVNIQRCIETFGRHNTDKYLQPKPPSTSPRDPSIPRNEKTPRAGPDTGSSEVQIGILTAKIRALAEFLDTRGRKDKVNKRNLRLMVHKRQKLLRYLRRRERGGERWQNCIKTLGLTEGTWRGEINL